MTTQSLAEPAQASLVPVPPHLLMEYVRAVVPLLDHAVARSGDMTTADVMREVASGNLQLWVAEQDDRVIGAAVTKSTVRPRRSVVTVLYVGSANIEACLPLLEHIEGWAKQIGARCVQVVGRKGWKRLLKGYRADSVVLTKDLADVG